MKVEVLASINSGQFNVGDVTDFPDSLAEYFIKKGIARKVPEMVEENENLKAELEQMKQQLKEVEVKPVEKKPTPSKKKTTKRKKK